MNIYQNRSFNQLTKLVELFLVLILAAKSPLKLMKIAFFNILTVLFVHKIFKVSLYSLVMYENSVKGKLRVTSNFLKFFDVTDWQ